MGECKSVEVEHKLRELNEKPERIRLIGAELLESFSVGRLGLTEQHAKFTSGVTAQMRSMLADLKEADPKRLDESHSALSRFLGRDLEARVRFHAAAERLHRSSEQASLKREEADKVLQAYSTRTEQIESGCAQLDQLIESWATALESDEARGGEGVLGQEGGDSVKQSANRQSVGSGRSAAFGHC